MAAPVITKVTRGSGSGADPSITITLGTVSKARLVLVGLYNKEGFGSVYASALDISGGASLSEETSARFAAQRGGDRHKGQLFWLKTDASGSTTFDVTLSTSDTTQLVAIELSDDADADALGAIIVDQADSNAGLSESITTTAADSLLVVFAAGERHPVNPGAGITTEINDEILTNDVVYVGRRAAPTATSYSMAIDFDNDNFDDGGGMWVVEVKESNAIAGTGAATLDDLAGSATGALAIAGEAATTLQGAVGAGSGSLAINGQAAAALSDLIGTGTGAQIQPITATAAATLNDVTTTGTGSLAIAGQAAATLQDLSGSGAAVLPIAATAAAALDAVQASATAGPVVSGTASATLDALTGAAAASLAIEATAGPTLDGLVGSASAALAIGGAAAATLHGTTGAGAGALAISAQASAVTDSIVGNAGAGVLTKGVGAAILDDAVSAGVGGLAIAGTGAETLGGVSATASGSLTIEATATAGLRGTIPSGSGVLALTGAANAILDGVAGTGAASLAITGSADSGLDAVIGGGSGVTAQPVTGVVSTTLAGVAASALGHRSVETYSICTAIAFVLEAELSPAVTVYCDRRRPIPPDKLPAIDVRRKLLSTNYLDRGSDLATAGIDCVVFQAGASGDRSADSVAADIERIVMNSKMIDLITLDIVVTDTATRYYEDGDTVHTDVAVQFDANYVETRL